MKRLLPMTREELERRLATIPKEWITRAEAVDHIIRTLELSRDEAEKLLDDFAAACPNSVKTVPLQ